MRRVYVVFFVRKVVKPFVIKMGSVAALAVAVAALVSVQNVLGNMPSPAEFVSFGKFIFSAFANTELSVQALSLAVALLTRDAHALLARGTVVAAAGELRVGLDTLYRWRTGGWLSGGGR